MNRLWNRARQIVWMAVLAFGLILSALIFAILGDTEIGTVLALSGIGCALLARQT